MPTRASALPHSWPPPYPLHLPIVTSTAQAWDRAAEASGIESWILMEHAALGVAALAAELVAGPGASIVIVAGPGHNGGDGYVAARHLAGWGRRVEVVAVGPPPSEAVVPPLVRRAAAQCAAAGVPLRTAGREPGVLPAALAHAGLIVDALFGVGLRRPLTGVFLEAVERMNAAGGLRLSVDVPSGMDADSGAALPVCVEAHVTATMAAPKQGFAPGRPGARAAGRVVEVDVGLPWSVHGSACLPAAARR